jgi:hypothetical protein
VSRWRERAAWVGLTLPLAPLAVLVYVASEWLFAVTRPSALASQPFGTQIRVLAGAPLPTILPLLGVQLAASVLSVVSFRRFAAVAVVPAASILGALLLMLVDNFTYTLFGFGILTSDGVTRVVYAALLPASIVLSANRLSRTTCALSASRSAVAMATTIAAVLALVAIVFPGHAPAVDTAAPPLSRGTGPASQPNILILGIDGVDATSLSAYGYERDTSPYLSILKGESLFFENAFSNVGRTHGSLVSLLTGRLPFSTHVTFPPTALKGEDARRHLPARTRDMPACSSACVITPMPRTQTFSGSMPPITAGRI